MARRKRIGSNLALSLILLVAVLAGLQGQRRPPAAQRDVPGSGTLTGKCIGVTDGDTIRVLYKNQAVKVRLWGVDAPEKTQAFGKQSKKFTSSVVFGKNVTVEVRDTDRYGRTVGWVKTADGRELNLELVKKGYAWWYVRFAANDTKLENAQRKARSAKIGLWKDKNPIAPWDYRSSRRKN